MKKGSELEMWDAEHDVKGKKLDGSAPLGHVILEGLDFSDLSWTRSGGTGNSGNVGNGGNSTSGSQKEPKEGSREGSNEGSRDGLIV